MLPYFEYFVKCCFEMTKIHLKNTDLNSFGYISKCGIAKSYGRSILELKIHGS